MKFREVGMHTVRVFESWLRRNCLFMHQTWMGAVEFGGTTDLRSDNYHRRGISCAVQIGGDSGIGLDRAGT